MKEKLGTKAAGFYVILLAALLGIISIIRFTMWGSAHNTLDEITMAALIAAVVVDIILLVKDNDYLIIVATICYSVAMVKLLTDSVGSFVDAFQGIKMFGDATQVGTIVSISVVIGGSVLVSIISGFLKRVKE